MISACAPHDVVKVSGSDPKCDGRSRASESLISPYRIRVDFACSVTRICRMRRLAPLALGGVIACVATTGYTRLPDGTWGVSIGCSDIKGCRDQAAETCPNGYEILQAPPDVRAP